jgi:Xaa-Pro aminopeptidase
MKSKLLTFLFGLVVLNGCSSATPVDSHLISASGIDVAFLVSKNTDLLGQLEYSKADTKSHAALNQTQTDIKVFKDEENTLTLTQVRSCNNCNYHLVHEHKNKLSPIGEEHQHTYIGRKKLASLYLEHPVYVDKIRAFISANPSVAENEEACIDVIVAFSKTSRIDVGTLTNCAAPLDSHSVKNVQMVPLS